MNLDQNAIFQAYDPLRWTLFIADDDDNLIGNSSDDTTVSGMTISYFNVMPMKPTLGSDDYSKTRLEIQLQYKYRYCILYTDHFGFQKYLPS